MSETVEVSRRLLSFARTLEDEGYPVGDIITGALLFYSFIGAHSIGDNEIDTFVNESAKAIRGTVEDVKRGK